jgi:lipoprotein-anchoring transpeptidase ErfK/SrfK
MQKALLQKAVLISIVALGGVPLAGAAAKAEPARPGNLGGGFIEMLMTGRTPPPRAMPVPGVIYAAPPQAQPAPPRAMVRPLSSQAPMIQAPIIQAPMSQARMGQAPNPQRYASLPDPMRIEQAFDPRFERQRVDYDGSHKPGTIVIDTSSKYLYLVQPGGTALRYGIGVGRPGFLWQGVKSVTRKAEWPDWRPPTEMLRRRPDLPRYMAGGPDNPLGARALYLGSSLYRIHGTNEPNTIGQNVSSGCFRLRNEDVMDLYNRVSVGAKVVVL